MRKIIAFRQICRFPEDFIIVLIDLDVYYDLNNKIRIEGIRSER
jgi:hypothetical protein